MAPAFLAQEGVRLAALLALAAPFVVSGAAKLADLAAAEAEVSALGLAPARPVALAVIAVQFGGALLLFVPGLDWIGAGLLAGFTVAATLVAHRPRGGRVPMPFWEHMGLAGGLLIVAVMSARGMT